MSMHTKMRVTWALVFSFSIVMAACASRDNSSHESALDSFKKNSKKDDIYVIRAAYLKGKETRLTIESITLTKGNLPYMEISSKQEGRLELVDKEGHVIWEMGYKPRDGYLFLRALGMPNAEIIRLREPRRNLSAVKQLPGQ